MSEIRALIDNARADGRMRLTEFEAKQVLACAGLCVTREGLASTEDEAVACARKIGFPVALKVVSPDIFHKSDVGGVKLNLDDDGEVRQAYREIMQAAKSAHPRARIDGALVAEMAASGVETFVGVANRPPFGPVVAFGMGGILVELLKDVTFRLAPVDEAGAAEMLSDIKAARLLDGYRGSARANRSELSRAIARLSELAIELSGVVEELDVNPLVVNADRAVAVDALITLKAPGEAKPRRIRCGRDGMRAVLEPRSIAVIGA